MTRRRGDAGRAPSGASEGRGRTARGIPPAVSGPPTPITRRAPSPPADRYRLLFERSFAGFYVATPEGQVVDCNPSFAAILGYDSPEEILELDRPVLAPDAGAPIAERARDGHVEVLLRRKDGSPVWVLKSEVETALPEGRFVQGTLVDITERKQAEDALLDRARDAALVTNVAVALTGGDSLRRKLQRCAEAIVRHLDAACARIWTLDEPESMLILQASAGIPTHLDGPHVRIRMGEHTVGYLAETRQPYWTNAAIGDGRIADQTWLERLGVVSFAGHPLLVEDRLVGVMETFSSQPLRSGAVKALASAGNAIAVGIERERAEEALRESERKYHDLVQQAPEPIVRYDERGRMQFMNAAAERVTGYAADELVGMPFADVNVLTPPSAPLAIEELRRLLAGEERPPSEWQLVRKDGRAITVEATPRLLLHDGKVTGVQVAFRDITTEKREEQRRRELEGQLRQAQKMEAIGRLAGGVAHDFNNLLAVILNYAGIAMEELPLASPIRLDIEEIHRAAQRAAALTRQLLIFSRKEVVEPAVVSLNEIVADMERLLRRTIGEDIELVTSLGRSTLRVCVDRGQIEQVIMNLALNARDAMPSGGRLTIETSVVAAEGDEAAPGLRSGRYVRLVVRDTGCGMTPEVLSHAFEPFFTTKPKGKGTGLGLSTVYGIVQSAEGRIDLRSEPGKGTEATILLPAAARGAAASAKRKKGPGLRGRGETVLVAEDEDAVRKLTCRILARNGYAVLEARGPGDAVLASERHEGRIDLLLTDVVMPQMSGTELAERLARERPDMRVLYMSGYTDDVIARHAVQRDGVALVQKPFTKEGLLARVRQALDRSPA